MSLPRSFKKGPLHGFVHVACCSWLYVQIIPLAHAAPSGGEIVGGTGSIAQTTTSTTIQQNTQNMAINWQSYDVNANERVQYIQPNASSISLNRILSNQGSTIAGRIDANGQVILVNPNGIFFTPTAILNVGGIIASGLDIRPADFMNGQFIFSEVLGTEGAVVNSGLINASLGGNVALIGRHVENNGVIAANLGTVNLVAGKEAVLTFDDAGLLGVRVTKEVLQKELGVEPAVENSGEIQAQGGRVLLTASTSRDVFSRAVNTRGLEEATSVVVHEDGSFTLGDGADVVSSGSIDVSTTSSDQGVGRIVLLGDNVTSSGVIKADAAHGNAGEVELHAHDTAQLTHNSVTSARSASEGNGGIVKVLGDKVGLFDQSAVDASGANGGGQVLIGGDQQGMNPLVRNANFIYLSNQSQIDANALDHGDGGKIITFAGDTARIFGDLSARGGTNGGNGGFIETSGLQGFEIHTTPDAGAAHGRAGLWLIDPFNLTIEGGSATIPSSTADGTETFSPIAESTLGADTIAAALGTSNVTITTGGSGSGDQLGNISLTATADINYNAKGDRTLTLQAANDISFAAGSRIYDGQTSTIDKLNLTLQAGGAVTVASGASITTQGGDFTVGSTLAPVASFTNNGTVNTFGLSGCDTGGCRDGGNVSIYTTGNIITTGLSTFGRADDSNSITYGGGGGTVVLNASGSSATIAVNGAIDTHGGNDTQGSEIGGNAGSVILSAAGGISLADNISAKGGSVSSGTAGNGAAITLTGPVTLKNNITLDASGATSGDIAVNGAVNGQDATARNLTLTGQDVTVNAMGDTRPLGTLTVDAIRSIDLTGNVTTTGSVTMNFGSGAAGAFTVDPNLTFSTGMMRVMGGANSDTFNIYSVFTGAVDGQGGTDTLTGPNGDTHAWSISSEGGGTLDTKLTFAGMENLTGGNGVDGFTFVTGTASSGLISGTVDGGAGPGINTLTGRDAPNTWAISGANTGTARAGVQYVAFNNIQNLTGGNGNDDFNFTQSTSAIDGTLDGGTGANTLSLAGRNGANTFTITGANAGDVRATGAASANIINSFSNIQTVAGGTGSDTLIAPDTALTWTINGTSNTMGSLMQFTSMENLLGALTQDDTFNFTVNPTGISLDGRGQATGDTVSLSGVSGPVSVTIGAAGLANIEHYTGNDTASTLIGENNENTWTLAAKHSGEVDGIGFSGFTALKGGSGDDTFKYSVTPTVANMTIDAGGQVSEDHVNVSTLTDAVTLQLGADGVANIERVTGNDTNTTLIGAETANAWTLTARHEGAVNTVDFTGITALQGANTQNDTFDFTVHPDVAEVTLDGRGQTAGGRDAVSFATLAGQTVKLDLGATRFRNIERYTGNNTHSTLTGGGGSNTWTLTGQNDGTVRSIEFFDFNQLVGGGADDRFTLGAGGQLTGLIDGGGGADTLILPPARTSATRVALVDAPPATVNNAENTFTAYQIEFLTGDSNRNHTLIGPDAATTWAISDANGGNMNFGPIVYFSGFANLTGGAKDDIFNLSSTTTPELVTGIIDGGGHETEDTLTLAGMTGGATNAVVRLSATPTNGAIDAANIEQITGNNSSALIAADTPNTWLIHGANDGTIGAAGTLAFSDMRYLLGGADDDTFRVVYNDVLTASIDGGREHNGDIADYSGQSIVNLSVGADSFNGITGLEGVRGNGTNSTLNGPTPANASEVTQWTVNGVNRGAVSYASNTQTLKFEGFNYLKGGDGTDAFVINGGALMNTSTNALGMISGGAGTNSLAINLNSTGVFTGGINYVGGADTDAITINNGSANRFTAVYTPEVAFSDPNSAANNGAFEQLSYRYTDASAGVDQAFTLNYRNAETVSSEQPVDTFTVLGMDNNSVPETLTLDRTSFAVDGRRVGFSDVTNITLDGRSGIDTIVLDNPSVAGTLRLAAESVVDTKDSSVLADTVVLDDVGQFGTATDAIDTRIKTLDIRKAGPVYITEEADLDIRTTGDVTNTGAFRVGGTTGIDAGGGSLTLDNADNDFDFVNATKNAQAITLHDADNIIGGDIRADKITLVTGSGVGYRVDKVTVSPLQIHTAALTIDNKNNGVYVKNDQATTVSIVTKGEIHVRNTGNLAVDKLYANGGDFSSMDAITDKDEVYVRVDGGAVIAARSKEAPTSKPDIIGKRLTVVTSTTLGTAGRRMSIMVPDTFGYYGPRGQGYVYYYGREPNIVLNKDDLAASIDFTNLSNQQMIEVESLANIDPAIFTAVRNYYYADESVRMPDDQRYNDEEDEEDRKRRQDKFQ
ncbi:MAG: filamentous hemagglutinin N-terminal domain-containing protein [Pseudomonadota bacterium]